MQSQELETVRRDLHAGRGRAVLYLLKQHLAQYRDLILDACVHNRAYDPQLEYNRAQYLLPLIRKSGEEAFYRARILAALPGAMDSHDAQQILDFAVIFARDGDSSARAAIHAKLRQHHHKDISGAGHLIELDGIDGLLFVLDRIGSDPEILRLYDDDDYLVHIAEVQCGAEEIRQALEIAARTNPRIAAYLKGISRSYTASLAVEDVIRSHESRASQQDPRPAVRKLSWAELKRTEGRFLTTWGVSAPDSELVQAAMDTVSEDDPTKCALYLRIFLNRPFPLEPKLLISLVQSPSLKVMNAAIQALARLQHPDVRALYEQLVEHTKWADAAVTLLPRNYREGDHLKLVELMAQEDNLDQLHSLGVGVLAVYGENDDPKGLEALRLMYDKGPCSMCRHSSVELMRKLGGFPEEKLEECMYDSDEELRELAAGLLSDEGPTA